MPALDPARIFARARTPLSSRGTRQPHLHPGTFALSALVRCWHQVGTLLEGEGAGALPEHSGSVFRCSSGTFRHHPGTPAEAFAATPRRREKGQIFWAPFAPASPLPPAATTAE